MRLFVLLLCFPLILSAVSLAEKYPDYRYVLSEFDIESGFIDNSGFAAFAAFHEKGMHTFYRHSLYRGKSLLSMVRGELLEEGVSDLFLYISMVESGLSTDIVSPKKAVGLWQFMPRTARSYRLEVCDTEDERCDPYTATGAAIRHLKRLRKLFGKWYLAVMAYNCGEGRLQRAIAKANTDDLSVLTDPDSGWLPAETRIYIYKILLLAMIGENETVDFTFFPDDTFGAAEGKRKSAYPQSDDSDMGVPSYPYLLSHTVALGDTLEKIAVMYDSSAGAIMQVNHLSGTFLEVGTVLVIPVSEVEFQRQLERDGRSSQS